MKKIELDGRQKIWSMISIICILVLLIMMIIKLLPWIHLIVNNGKNQEVVASEITGLGVNGVLTIIFLSILQVVSIVFPGAPIRIISGLSFGILKGYLITMTGVAIGNIIVFILVRRFNNIVKIQEVDYRGESKLKNAKWNFIDTINKGNLKKIAFLLLLIPGVPKGLLPYIFAKTDIKISNYLLILIIATSPASIMSILIGERLARRDLISAIIIGLLLLIISLFVTFNKNKIISFLKKDSIK